MKTTAKVRRSPVSLKGLTATYGNRLRATAEPFPFCQPHLWRLSWQTICAKSGFKSCEIMDVPRAAQRQPILFCRK